MNKKGQANNAESPLKGADNQLQPEQEQPNEENIQEFM